MEMGGAGDMEDEGGDVFADARAFKVGCEVVVEGHGNVDEGRGDVGGGRGDIDEDREAVNEEDVLADAVRASTATSTCVEVSRMGCKRAHGTVVTPSPPSVSPITCSSTSPTLASFFRSLGPLTSPA